MYIANCGGLKYNPNYFKVINNVLTLKNKETIENYFRAPMCGSLQLDADIFEDFLINNKHIIGLKNTTPQEYMSANCSLLLDKSKFIIDSSQALCLKEK